MNSNSTESGSGSWVLVALGSNLGDSPALLRAAMDRIEAWAKVPVLRSSLWTSTPMDCPPGSPIFLNAAVAFQAPGFRTPEEWLGWSQTLEQEFGRGSKKTLNEPRPLDVDLIAWGGEKRSSELLALPHPRATQRRFVLAPLSELCPDLHLPGTMKTIAQLLKEAPEDPLLRKWDGFKANLTPQPLGLNQRGYCGEQVDMASVIREIRELSLSEGWEEERLLADSPRELLCLTRSSRTNGATRSLYLSAGIHGDEPAGPLAVRELFRRRAWNSTVNLQVCPCLNPTGFLRRTRENNQGIDLNRDYLNPASVEVRAHTAWLSRQPAFDGVLCLHEDWESKGFYCYELFPVGLSMIANQVANAVQHVCPLDLSTTIDGRPTTAPGIIIPSIDPLSRPLWPEAFWLWNRDMKRSLTLEAPSDFPLQIRIEALVTGVLAAMRAITQNSELI